MGTLNAVYVRGVSDLSKAAVALRSAFPHGEILLDGPVVGAELPPDAVVAPEDALTRLSAELRCDVFWLGFQSAVDAFQYHHWREGALARSLVYGCFGDERTWDRVSGVAEAWEKDAIFSAAQLQDLLKGAETDADRATFERIWREGEILPGRIDPMLDARETARAVSAFYDLPGW